MGFLDGTEAAFEQLMSQHYETYSKSSRWSCAELSEKQEASFEQIRKRNYPADIGG